MLRLYFLRYADLRFCQPKIIILTTVIEKLSEDAKTEKEKSRIHSYGVCAKKEES